MFFDATKLKKSSRPSLCEYISIKKPSNSKHFRVHYNNNNNNNTNNDNNITSMALKSSEARAQKRNKTKSVIIFKSRGHTGVIISLRGRRLFKGEKQFLRYKF